MSNNSSSPSSPTPKKLRVSIAKTIRETIEEAQLQTYVERMGLLHAAIYLIEIRIRNYFFVTSSAPSSDLDQVFHAKTGDLLPKNDLTSCESFGYLLKRYNKSVAPGFQIDTELERYRHLLVHGRLFADPKNQSHRRLLNFTGVKDNPKTMRVSGALEATDFWFGRVELSARHAVAAIELATKHLVLSP
jgi:hypothetical protein